MAEDIDKTENVENDDVGNTIISPSFSDREKEALNNAERRSINENADKRRGYGKNNFMRGLNPDRLKRSFSMAKEQYDNYVEKENSKLSDPNNKEPNADNSNQKKTESEYARKFRAVQGGKNLKGPAGDVVNVVKGVGSIGKNLIKKKEDMSREEIKDSNKATGQAIASGAKYVPVVGQVVRVAEHVPGAKLVENTAGAVVNKTARTIGGVARGAGKIVKAVPGMKMLGNTAKKFVPGNKKREQMKGLNAVKSSLAGAGERQSSLVRDGIERLYKQKKDFIQKQLVTTGDQSAAASEMDRLRNKVNKTIKDAQDEGSVASNIATEAIDKAKEAIESKVSLEKKLIKRAARKFVMRRFIYPYVIAPMAVPCLFIFLGVCALAMILGLLGTLTGSNLTPDQKAAKESICSTSTSSASSAGIECKK